MVLQRKLLEKDGIGGIRRLAGYGGSLAEQVDISRDGKTAVATGDQSSKGLWVVPVQPVSPAKQLISGDSCHRPDYVNSPLRACSPFPWTLLMALWRLT